VNVLVVGGGGREHALLWTLKNSKRVSSLYAAPGNAGTAGLAQNLPLEVSDIKGLVLACLEHNVKFVVVGPEVPLALGLVDALTKVGVRAFGPTAAAAQLEASKAFAKRAMLEFGVPTAGYAEFDALEPALASLRGKPFSNPGFVVKADGLAAGKGVNVCDTLEDAEDAVSACFSGTFGEAGARVVIEERLTGRELSVLAFCDGKTVKPMLAARDHKRALDGDRGANTGGMGAFAPAPDITDAFLEEIRRTVLEPTLRGMAKRGTPYKGVLYAGLMLTSSGPKVIEFNCRFGDPEAQVVLPLLETDLFDVLDACVAGTLDAYDLRWKPGVCATVVLASRGYPERSETGKVISGLETVPEGVTVFHAATKPEDGAILTSGGRVLNVTAVADTLEAALEKAYQGVSGIAFDGMQYRTDIGKSTLEAVLDEAPNVGIGAQHAAPLQAQADAYADAGVNIAEGARAVALMKDAVRSTHDARVLAGVGAFGGMMDVSSLKNLERPVLVASTDGVGTKTMIAAQLDHWDGIGADIVNHGINDVLAQGAKPLFFMDYIAASKLKAEWVAAVVSGMARACKAAGCALLGGETAEMPGVYRDGESDVVGTMVGVVDFAHAITGSRVAIGDALIAFPSSGLHTNGYTLARKTLADLDWIEARDDLHGKSIGAALLEPHRSYLEHVLALQRAGVDVRALAHITGGGLWDNLPRVLPEGVTAAVKRGSWTAPPIFDPIVARGGISERDAFHAFNMGLGMIAVIPAAHVHTALETLPNECFAVGEIRALEGERVVLE
jgi:phosphoribosylamine--glycine ligase/phosphoribosylformylglycinamidine cyclo-ligase